MLVDDGTSLERKQFYRNAERKLGISQRAKKKKQVKNIHVKIKINDMIQRINSQQN